MDVLLLAASQVSSALGESSQEHLLAACRADVDEARALLALRAVTELPEGRRRAQERLEVGPARQADRADRVASGDAGSDLGPG